MFYHRYAARIKFKDSGSGYYLMSDLMSVLNGSKSDELLTPSDVKYILTHWKNRFFENDKFSVEITLDRVEKLGKQIIRERKDFFTDEHAIFIEGQEEPFTYSYAQDQPYSGGHTFSKYRCLDDAYGSYDEYWLWRPANREDSNEVSVIVKVGDGEFDEIWHYVRFMYDFNSHPTYDNANYQLSQTPEILSDWIRWKPPTYRAYEMGISWENDFETDSLDDFIVFITGLIDFIDYEELFTDITATAELMCTISTPWYSELNLFDFLQAVEMFFEYTMDTDQHWPGGSRGWESLLDNVLGQDSFEDALRELLEPMLVSDINELGVYELVQLFNAWPHNSLGFELDPSVGRTTTLEMVCTLLECYEIDVR